MFDQDHGPPTKRAVEVSPNGPSRFGLSHDEKASQGCPETSCKSSQYGDRYERFITTLRGALASAETALWPGVTLVAVARLALRERVALAFSALRTLPDNARDVTSLAAHLGGVVYLAIFFAVPCLRSSDE